jgi:hypothetical protein
MVVYRSFVFERGLNFFLLYVNFILKLTRAAVGLLITVIHQLIIIIKLLAMSLQNFVYLQLKNSAIEIF